MKASEDSNVNSFKFNKNIFQINWLDSQGTWEITFR